MRPSGKTDDTAGILLHNDPHLKVEAIRSGDDVKHVGLVQVPVLEILMNPVLSYFKNESFSPERSKDGPRPA